MFKTVGLLKRKPSLAREAFIRHYETVHVPLMRALLPQITEYRRNYLNRDIAVVTPGAADPDFDVITEIYFADREAYDAAMAASAKPEVWAQIAADAQQIFDMSQTRLFAVDERG